MLFAGASGSGCNNTPLQRIETLIGPSRISPESKVITIFLSLLKGEAETGSLDSKYVANVPKRLVSRAKDQANVY